MAKAHVPEGVRFATKPAIAVAMVCRAIAAGVPFAWVAADTVYGVGEVEMALRRAGKGYVLGVTGAHHVHSWSPVLLVYGTAQDITKALPADAWARRSAGDGTKGPRLYDWAYLELAVLDPEMVGAPPGLGIWTRGLLVRRRPADGALANFTTWCPKGTPVDTLVRLEGQRWAIEDAFETAKNELDLDHNETRSWHGWHRHVSLWMLAFALLAVLRHKTETLATPPKTMRTRPRPWSAGACRKSVVLPAV